MKFSVLETKVAEILEDASNVTYTVSQIQQWLAESELAILNLRPDANVVTGLIPLIAGSQQSLPVDGLRLFAIVRNENGRAVRLIDRAAKDELEPDWHTEAQGSVVKEYVFDDRAPKTFFVSPPSVGSVNVVASYCETPATPNFGSDPDISLDDVYSPAMIDYAVYRCFSRADQNTPDYARSNGFYQAFLQKIGAKTEADYANSPKTRRQNQ